MGESDFENRQSVRTFDPVTMIQGCVARLLRNGIPNK